MCGCDSETNGHCKNCNSSYNFGYVDPNFVKSQPPGTDGAICSVETEYTDVSDIVFS